MKQDSGVGLNFLAESREFRTFCEIVNNLTGITASLHDHADPAKERRIIPEKQMSPLCRLVRATSLGLALCRASDKKGCTSVEKMRKGTSYLCHAGLLEMAIPLYIKGDLVVTIMSGGILPRPRSEPNFRQLCEKVRPLGLSLAELRKAYEEAPYIPPEKFGAALKLFEFFARYLYEVGEHLKENENVRMHRRIGLAIRYIHDHHTEAIGRDEVAKAASLSPAYFGFLFTKVTGLTFTEYLQRLRADYAAKNLERTDETITRIAFDSGFNSLTHFNRVFRKFYDCSPREYRKKKLILDLSPGARRR